ncbi:TonB-dependent receptor plug domain-containing protein [Flavobacterium piscis]|uniref:TonB-dependent SusC/RagA subfamily outer membrane receptor n=1 Tax=Flavobacterium piscis TaxID=1114874 RepID=A0ABU1Y5V9_9FLAO|nr:TonB-dependent receptor plug domain-containing protein [Flavobacterium piscis]MDR7209065.1 TonB-dependent SusC/RagA subfamily outer membrane receptor [Flavobacterium piscis]
MKNIVFVFLLLSTVLLAQKNDKNWERVIAYENEGKVKSANDIVTKIYKRAVTDKDEVQMIKSFFYQSKYLQVADENAQTKILRNLKSEINRVSIPSKAILNLVYAKCLDDYYNRNSYQIRQKTNTTFLDENFLTWTDTIFKNQIDTALKQTLSNEKKLKATLLSQYEPVFDYFTLEKFKDENLFDYLLKENIKFYTHKIQHWQIQKNDFNTIKDALLGKPKDFTKLNFGFVTESNLKKTLSLFQKQEIEKPTPENQFERMQFCHTYLTTLNDDDFLKSLNSLQKKSNDTNLIQKIQLEKALTFKKLASKETHPDYNNKAIALLDSIIMINNRSNAYKLAIQNKQSIIFKSLNIQLQKQNYSDENTRAFIQFKNINRLAVSFYKINQKEIQLFKNSSYPKDSLAENIIENQKPAVSENYNLLNKNDYFEYTTEVLLPQLKTGSYLVYFESDSDLKTGKAFAFETISVSNLAVLATQKKDTQIFLVTDRKTGKPLENISVNLLNQSIKTDKNGLASFIKENNYYNQEPITLSSASDTLSLTKSYLGQNNDYSTNEKEENKGNIEFYLDRAIYRPGQTVYYKGIVIQKIKNKASVVTNTGVKITILDANYKSFKEFEVTTNEFGSFSGEFVLPKTGLTGTFTIDASAPKVPLKIASGFWKTGNFGNAITRFRVEEYKRPKFEVRFEPKKDTYRVNQNIKVAGIAKAFAGSTISDAKVTYTISRFTSYIKQYYYEEEKETIATGETQTDAAGKFVVNFDAQPSKNAVQKEFPVFNYQINVTVTDINGETHTAETIMKIGYHDLLLSATISNEIETKNKNKISLTSTNLNGEFLAVKGELKLYYVSPFSNKFKNRVFPQPEIQQITDSEFERLFPYEKNSKTNTLKSNKTLLLSKKIDTSIDKKLILDFITNYKSGNYQIVFSAKDSFDNPIETYTDFQLTQSKDKFNPRKLFTAEQINSDPKKDGFILIKLASVIPELYIATTGNYRSQIYFSNMFHLENNELIAQIPLQKDFEEKLNIGFESVFENEVFNDQIQILLKKEEPKLEIDVSSFRNKIEPGSKENWSFQLKSTNTRNEAEILASMYDSSLDQFTITDWDKLTFVDYNYNSANFKTRLGFDKTSNSLRNLNPSSYGISLNDETTKLIWFGFNFNDSFNHYQQNEYLKQVNKKLKKPDNAKLIYGIITEKSGLILPGVIVNIKGTQRATVSDFDGYYEIEAAVNEELIFSFIGFKNKSVLVGNKKTVDVVLTHDYNALNEVLVIGYGKSKRKDLTGAISSISGDELRETRPVTIDQALQGKIAGVMISGQPGDGINVQVRGQSSFGNNSPLYVIDGVIIDGGNGTNPLATINPSDILSIDVLKDNKATALYGSKGANGVIIITTKKALEALTQVKARKNLSETAFFLPNLKTDAKGNINFNFTSPEALTSWKLRLLAHNKEAVSGYLEKSVVTQKELMILPNFPRFFREKDTIVISTKISNITNDVKTGIAILQFFDAATMQPIDAKMMNLKNVRNFTIPAYGNTTANWTISIPEGLQGVQYKILAKSGNFSDGEENILPVLTNNRLVTESIPIWVRENSTKEYTFENLKNNTSSTLKNHQFTLEYTSNPAWIAIQSLPYLMEYEHECAEQTFARFYANTLASEIISSNPKIATVFEDWRKNGKLKSKLEENEELKSIILAETPWLNDAQSEDEKKKNLALLFDLEKMKTSQKATFDKLKQKQKSSGGFAWFDGSDENEYITRHILSGLGHLSKLSKNNISQIDQIAKTGIPFLDHNFLTYHKARTKNLKATDKLMGINPYSDLHYLYTRSFYLDKYPLSDTLKKATKLYLETAKKDWLSYSLYEKGLAALTLNRFGESESAKKIIESLKETSSNNEDWGMYWITNKAGWYWYQAPIETQALLIEAFAEVNHDTKSVDAMKVWLLKNKQTKNWPTTKSTTEAVYALLMHGNDWLSVKDNTIIKIGDEKILTKKLSENEKEAETGYIKLNWKADEIKKEMATINIQNKTKVPGFGGVYWQYFEDLDKIKNNSGAVLSVSKELYLKKNTMKGDELQKITSKNELKTGDLVTVRLVISSKEDMEFVHLKDMRASCFEPVNVLSEYQYKDRLGYYTSTKDAATHFFFDRINKGTYVLEYDIRVNNSGEFSNGITTIQSMYAPEFSSHTKGIRVKVIQQKN